MTRKQLTLLVVMCALVSAFVSVVVVAGAVLILRDRVTSVAQATEAVAGPPAGAAEGSPAPGETSQPAAGGTPVIHAVQPGDTITGLALQYDVPADDIIAANQLENPNFLTVGDKLVIPMGGVVIPAATSEPLPTPTDTPIPFEPPSAQMTATAAAEAGATVTPLPTPLPVTGVLEIEIVEVVMPGAIAQEGITVRNQGARLADMTGWTLGDAEGNSYTFPSFRLWSGGSVTVFTRTGQDGSPPAALYWGRREAAWSVGEQATLKDEEGATVATFAVR